MEDFDFLGDGTGSQSAPKSKFERDLEKFGDISTLKDAKKAEEERLRQAGKSYDISEKDDPGAAPLEKPDALKRRANIDRDELIGMSSPVPSYDEDAAEAYAAKYAEALESGAPTPPAGAVTETSAPLPSVTYAASDVQAEDDGIVVVKNEDEDDEPSAPKPTTAHTVAPRQDNGLPVLADLSDTWVEEAAKNMGYEDIVLSEREKQQIRQKEESKLAKHLEKSLREKTRVSESVYSESILKTAKIGRAMVFICSAVCIALGGFSYFFLDNEIIRYAGAILAGLAVLNFIKLRFFSRVFKLYLLLSAFAFAFPGLLTEMYNETLTAYDTTVYTIGVVISLAVMGVLAFAPPVAKYYNTDMRKSELQI
jgi:hypothetical protein